MFGWFTPRKNHKQQVRSSQLRLEQMEDRICLDMGGGVGSEPPPNLPPLLEVDPPIYHGRASVTLSGLVSDEEPEGMIVVIDGAVNTTATVQADGSFEITTDADSVGDAILQTVDVEGEWSNAETVTLTNQPLEFVDFHYTSRGENLYEFIGQVSDDDPYGLRVVFDGNVATLNVETEVTINEYGRFSVVVQLRDPPEDTGIAQAVVEDWWGQWDEAWTDVLRS